MVMEAKPSPLVVGREFVRQYYTLLHNSPDHLHRFYNQHSSFTHKGWDPDASKDDVEDLPIVGQKNIHDKIQAMNFRDCHAKISHVDAQATLGDGVVVQVFGELSNDGHQMRRFTQTFVLACQSPKKYYVHNDIFRYHDIYCEDEEQQREEHESVVEPAGSQNSSDGSTNAPMIVQQSVFYAPPPPANVIAVNASPALVATGYPAAAVQTAPPPQVNGIMHEEMLKNIATQTSQTQLITAPAQVIPMAPAPTALPIPVEPVAVAVVPEVMPNVNVVATTISDYEADQMNGNESDTLDNSKDTDANSSDEAVKRSVPSPIPANVIMNNNNNNLLAQKNWATMVKAGPGINFTGGPPLPEVAAPIPQSFVAITQQQQQQAQQQQKQVETYSTVDRRQPRPAPNTTGGDRERRISNNANNNASNDGSSQLFLGNLPTAATEEELRTLFSVFGKITDLRIHPKQTQKGGSGRPGPNYGFITFENPASALRLQEAQPIYYPTLNDKRGTKLNIENKIRKNNESSGNSGRTENQDRGRNNNPGAGGMNRNGSGGRSDRRDGNRQFNRSERMQGGSGGGGGGGGPRQTNGNSGTFTNSRR